MLHSSSLNPFYVELLERVQKQGDLEQKLDELRLFKSSKTKLLETGLFQGRQDLKSTMEKLTDLADAMLMVAEELARSELRNTFGLPKFQDNDGNYLPSEFAIIGLGKLGGRELHFTSDLDLIFVFSRNGKTEGRRSVTNQEYFSKLAQRIISYLGLYTRCGYAYRVDTELRPSGNAGALVTDLDSWISYYHERAAIWEKQALLKARLIHATGNFSKDFTGLFKRLIFLEPFPEYLGREIHHLRMRIERELAKDSENCWYYKKGFGGLIDIEFSIQYLQLKLGMLFENLLVPNTLEALDKLGQRSILPDQELDTLKKAYQFYRMLEIILELKFNLKEGYLDLEYEGLPEIAESMSFGGKEDFLSKFREFRSQVREIYLKVLKIKED